MRTPLLLAALSPAATPLAAQSGKFLAGFGLRLDS
jgi:hypothetical protein